MAKGVIKDVARVLGLPFQDSNALTDLVPDQLKITLKKRYPQNLNYKNLLIQIQQLQKYLICVST